jgi:hypothetical protein
MATQTAAMRKLSDLFITQFSFPWSAHLRAKQRFDRAALVLRPVAFCDLLERQLEIEDVARVDGTRFATNRMRSGR